MKVAVMGAHTFLGARLVEMFHLGDGPTVVAVSRWPAQHILAARFAVDLRTADSLDPSDLGAALRGTRAIVDVRPTSVAEAQRSFGTLCYAAAKSGVRRLVFVSGAHASLAGANGDEDPFAAHAAVERRFLEDCRRESVSGIVLRVAGSYGPRSAAFADLITRLRQHRWPVPGPAAAFTGVYTDNLVTAVRQALRPKTPDQRVYPVDDGDPVTWGHVAAILSRELGLGAPGPASDATDSPSPGGSARQDSNRTVAFGTTADLGYEPVVNASTGLERSCAWWRFARGEAERSS